MGWRKRAIAAKKSLGEYHKTSILSMIITVCRQGTPDLQLRGKAAYLGFKNHLSAPVAIEKLCLIDFHLA